MKINILRKMEYAGHWIHVFHFYDVFQYIFADKKGNLYQHYITLPFSKLRYIQHKLGFVNSLFTTEELEIGEKIILSGAMDSIDALIAQEEKHKASLKTTNKIINTLKKDPRCQWMTTETPEGMQYRCINHDVYVKIVDGTIPSHDITKDSKVISPLQFSNE